MPSLPICIARTCFWCPSFETPWSLKGQTFTFWSPSRQGCFGDEHAACHWISHLYFDPRVGFCAAICLGSCLTCVDMAVIGKWPCFSMCLLLLLSSDVWGKTLCSFSGHRAHLLAQEVLYRAAAWWKACALLGMAERPRLPDCWVLRPSVSPLFFWASFSGSGGVRMENLRMSLHIQSRMLHFLTAPSCYSKKIKKIPAEWGVSLVTTVGTLLIRLRCVKMILIPVQRVILSEWAWTLQFLNCAWTRKSLRFWNSMFVLVSFVTIMKNPKSSGGGACL